MPRGHWLWQENLSERLHEVASRPSADPYLFLGVSVLARRRFHDMRLGALFTKARIGQALNNSDYFGWPISYNPRFNREKWHQVTGISEHEGEIYERLYRAALAAAREITEIRGDDWWRDYCSRWT